MTGAKAIVPLSLIAGSALYINAYSPNTPKEEIVANKVLQTKEELKDFGALKSIQLGGKQITSSNQIAHDNIQRIIVPSTKYSKSDEILLETYHRAVGKYFESNDPAIDPTCADLATLTPIIISESNCDKVKTIPFEFYEYNNGNIAYKVPDAVASKITAITGSQNEENLGSTASITSFVQKDNTTNLELISFERKLINQEKLQVKIDKFANEDPLLASRLNEKMLEANPTLAIKNNVRLSAIAQRKTLPVADMKVLAISMQKTQSLKEAIQKQNNIAISDSTNSLVSDENTSTVFINTYLSTQEKDEATAQSLSKDTEDSSIFKSIREN